MSALSNETQKWSLYSFKTHEQLQIMQEQEQNCPDLFELLLEDSSYQIICKPPALHPRKLKAKRGRGCRCSKIHCQQNYCDCLSGGRACGPSCTCVDCHNQKTFDQQPNPETTSIEAILSIETKKYPRFLLNAIQIKQKGCTCTKSGCLKNYCECFSNGKQCNSHCSCINCANCSLARVPRIKKQ